MKVAVSCDTLIDRCYMTSVVEAILMVYEDAEIYTLAHKEGEILGPVELRKIHSSFITSVIKDDNDKKEAFWKKSYLVPTASKKLTVPCNIDVLINISSGLSHNITRCEGVYQITYLLEDHTQTRVPKTFLEKLFKSYLRSWSFKALSQVDEVWLPVESGHKEKLEKIHKKVKLLAPFIKLEDFPLFPEAQHKMFPRDFITVDAQSFSKEDAQKLMSVLEEDNIKYRFIGSDGHLSELKANEDDKRFFGKRCNGELAPMLTASRGHLTNQKDGFPNVAIESLSSGVPVLFMNKGTSESFVNSDMKFNIKSGADIKNLWNKLPEVDRNVCHIFAKKFHEIKFKSEVKRRVERLDL
jgi:hypothetical protein